MNLSDTSADQQDLFDLSGLTSYTPTCNTTTSCFSAIGNTITYTAPPTNPYTVPATTTGGYVYPGGTVTILPGTSPTITTPGSSTTTYTFPNNGGIWPGVQPPGKITAGGFELTTKTDDDGKDTLVLSVGDRKHCAYKCQLLPGIFLYTNHGRPGFFQRLVMRMFFGMKWESTLAERFIEAL